MSDALKLGLLWGVSLSIIAAVFAFIAPIAQPRAYHHFADPRYVLGIPNFADVVSNAAFVPAGIYGLWVLSQRLETGYDRLPLAVFFLGVVLVAPGSGYYHWAPDNGTLFWDRLPMTIAFMGFLAAVISDRIQTRGARGRGVLVVLIVIGLASVLSWHVAELKCAGSSPACAGDLRAYVLVQFLPVLLIPLILWMWPHGTFISWRTIGGAFLFYGLSKLTEHFDREVLNVLGGTVSGHTVKHLFGALSPAAVAWTLRR